MELLLYLAEFQDEEGKVEDPLEVDRLMQSEATAPDTEKPEAADQKIKLQSKTNPQRSSEPAPDAS